MWGWWLSWGWGWGIGVEEIENQMEERESVEETTHRRDGERRRERESLMEERENLNGVKGC
jgi:hypothetical protein